MELGVTCLPFFSPKNLEYKTQELHFHLQKKRKKKHHTAATTIAFKDITKTKMCLLNMSFEKINEFATPDLINVMEWSRPWPLCFGAHHLITLIGSLGALPNKIWVEA
jgi:hypothetical protein